MYSFTFVVNTACVWTRLLRYSLGLDRILSRETNFSPSQKSREMALPLRISRRVVSPWGNGSARIGSPAVHRSNHAIVKTLVSFKRTTPASKTSQGCQAQNAVRDRRGVPPTRKPAWLRALTERDGDSTVSMGSPASCRSSCHPHCLLTLLPHVTFPIYLRDICRSRTGWRTSFIPARLQKKASLREGPFIGIAIEWRKKQFQVT